MSINKQSVEKEPKQLDPSLVDRVWDHRVFPQRLIVWVDANGGDVCYGDNGAVQSVDVTNEIVYPGASFKLQHDYHDGEGHPTITILASDPARGVTAGDFHTQHNEWVWGLRTNHKYLEMTWLEKPGLYCGFWGS